MRARSTTSPPISLPVSLDGRPYSVAVAARTAARRMTLRVDARTGEIRLTVPLGASLGAAQKFVESSAGWLLARLDLVTDHIPLVPGATVPVLGDRLCIVHSPEAGRTPRRVGTNLITGGEVAHIPRRVEDYLRATARQWLTERSRHHAALVDRRITGLTVRDTRSRWGSCSSRGALNFSWRLILTPEWVADYVVAHEVAHLVHLDHSPSFWSLCRRLAPQTDDARRWLKRHGPMLHRYGAPRRSSPL